MKRSGKEILQALCLVARHAAVVGDEETFWGAVNRAAFLILSMGGVSA